MKCNVIVSFKKRVEIMNMQIEFIRNKLENLIAVTDSIIQYYSCKVEIQIIDTSKYKYIELQMG
ncbi:hypothetical protein LGK95_11975 [Clostridium algoriphilum]|uniref:hypothetical protein n=1 Tax=Clostridium algoriphilum TaxID=198347 RepID=UPI001CF17543|nr:hypothetical protein [Clostridium algoriphilum]MCB2294233.1 hypothetical protein [Clostridium algoriphilum]